MAYVLAHSSVASEFAPKLVAATGRSRTKLNTLCNGNGDYFIAQGEEFNPIMTTEAAELISSAATLGGAVWPDLSELLGWSKDDVDHVFCHQVGKQVNGAFYREMGLDFEKEFTIYQRMGTLASEALPTALAIGSEEKQDMRRGDKVVLTGFGSGLNAMFVGLEW